MPHLTQHGSVLRWMHVHYTARRKLALLTMVKPLQDKEGILLTKSVECVKMSALLILKWGKLFSLGNNSIKALLKTKKKSIHPGPLGQLKPLKEVLVKYIFEQCKQGIEVSTLSIIGVALNLSTKFGKKDFVAWCSADKRFVHAHLGSFEWACIFASTKPEEVEAEASNYLLLICPSYLILIAFGISSSTWIRRRSIFQ
jgi:hypothetical protein